VNCDSALSFLAATVVILPATVGRLKHVPPTEELSTYPFRGSSQPLSPSLHRRYSVILTHLCNHHLLPNSSLLDGPGQAFLFSVNTVVKYATAYCIMEDNVEAEHAYSGVPKQIILNGQFHCRIERYDTKDVDLGSNNDIVLNINHFISTSCPLNDLIRPWHGHHLILITNIMFSNLLFLSSKPFSTRVLRRQLTFLLTFSDAPIHVLLPILPSGVQQAFHSIRYRLKSPFLRLSMTLCTWERTLP
jgi:hypothetical protein